MPASPRTAALVVSLGVELPGRALPDVPAAVRRAHRRAPGSRRPHRQPSACRRRPVPVPARPPALHPAPTRRSRGRRRNAARAAADPGGRLERGGSLRTGAAPPSAARTAASPSSISARASARTLSGRHEDRVHGLEFSPDGRTLATTADDGRVLVWDVALGHGARDPDRPHRPDPHHRGQRRRAHALHRWPGRPDHRLGHRRRTAASHARSRPTRSGAAGPSEYPPPLAVSPSGRIVAAGLPDGGVRLHDARTLRHLRDLPGIEGGPVRAVEFSPDGRAIAVTGEGGAVELRDVATGRRAAAAAARPRGARPRRWAFSPDGDRLAVADLDGNLRMLDLKTGAVRRAPQLAGLPGPPVLQPRRRDAGDRARRERHRAARRPLAAGRRPPAQPPGRRRRWVRFSPDGRLLAVSALRRLHAALGRGRRRPVGAPLSGHEDLVSQCGVLARRTDARDERSSTARVILWDVDSRRALGTLPGASAGRRPASPATAAGSSCCATRARRSAGRSARTPGRGMPAASPGGS